MPSFIRAPGKLILSGEHAVIYQQTALSMAIDRSIQTQITALEKKEVVFLCEGTSYRLSFETLQQLWRTINTRYQLFLQGASPVEKILDAPEALLYYCVADVLQATPPSTWQGFTVEVISTLPYGAGLGSSAALIVSTLASLMQYFHLNVTEKTFLQRAIAIESLQHGKSSGLDIHTAFRGGCLYFDKGAYLPLPPPTLSFYTVQTGAPITSTGECIQSVARYAQNHGLWRAFRDVTQSMKIALEKNDIAALKHAVICNHKLLVSIGVVPKPVQDLILAIEKLGAAAKISGAGAVRGDTAGTLWVVTDNIEVLSPLFKQYCLPFERIAPATQGVHHV